MGLDDKAFIEEAERHIQAIGEISKALNRAARNCVRSAEMTLVTKSRLDALEALYAAVKSADKHLGHTRMYSDQLERNPDDSFSGSRLLVQRDHVRPIWTALLKLRGIGK